LAGGFPVSVLGAVLAGGQSSRFGSDKALAHFGDATLLERAVVALKGQCDAVMIVGAPHGIPDWPRAGLGPLGGISAALHAARGHDHVLTCGVDTVGLPGDLLDRLSPAPAYLAAQPIVGLWPVDALSTLEAMIADGSKLAVRAFADRIDARAVNLDCNPANVNTREDLKAMERQHGF
jgi:molybdenum cofactor guanylyltransferase